MKPGQGCGCALTARRTGRYEVILDVPQESVAIAFGILLTGKGQAWLSEVQFEEVGAEVPTTSHEGHDDLPEKAGNLDFAEDGA